MYLDVFRMQLCEELEVDLNFLDTEVLYARYVSCGLWMYCTGAGQSEVLVRVVGAGGGVDLRVQACRLLLLSARPIVGSPP